MERVEHIIKTKRPDVYKELYKNKKKRKRKKKERKPTEEHLTFSDIDYMMRHNIGVDESRCRGR